MIRLSVPLLLVASPLVASPLAAQTMGIPPACTAFVTVQSANCSVKHLLTCAGDPEGQRISVVTYPEGGDSITILDAEAQWLVIADGYQQTVETLIEDQTNPALISELLEKGTDSFDYSTMGKDGTVTRYVGRERLTGATVSIDGVDLLVAEAQIQAIDAAGTQLWAVVGTEYVSADWKLYFGGLMNWTTPEQNYPSDSSPIAFDFPGDPGFLSIVPAYGCT